MEIWTSQGLVGEKIVSGKIIVAVVTTANIFWYGHRTATIIFPDTIFNHTRIYWHLVI